MKNKKTYKNERKVVSNSILLGPITTHRDVFEDGEVVEGSCHSWKRATQKLRDEAWNKGPNRGLFRFGPVFVQP